MNNDYQTQKLEKVMEEVKQSEIKENISSLSLLTIDEILALPDTETVWLVNSIVQSQAITIISGLPNHFKSLYVQMLVKAVASGTPFLNQFPVTKSSVLIVDRELPPLRLKRRWYSIGDLKGLPIYFYPYKQAFKLDNKSDANRLKDIVLKHNIKLVVIDTFNRSHSGKELNSPSEVMQVFEPLKELLEYTSIILIHHSNKSGYKNEIPSPEELLGSIDFVAETDSLFTLRKKDKTSVIVHNLKSRDSELILPFELTFAAYKEGKVELLYEGEIQPEDTPVEQREKAIIEFLKVGKKLRTQLITHMLGLGHNEKTVNNNLTVLRKNKIVDSEIINNDTYYFLLETNKTDKENVS